MWRGPQSRADTRSNMGGGEETRIIEKCPQERKGDRLAVQWDKDAGLSGDRLGWPLGQEAVPEPHTQRHPSLCADIASPTEQQENFTDGQAGP